MTRFAPVAPLPLLNNMWDREPGGTNSLHGSYHLLLAHDVLKDEANQKAYREHFNRVRDFFNYTCVVIMDNSIVELGNAVDMQVVARAGEICGADVLVLPDVMGEGLATIVKLREVMKGIRKFPLPNFALMAVPQGPTINDFARCLEAFMEYEEITWVGVPRIATQQLGSRQPLISLCKAVNPNWHLHLLGFSDNVVDDVLCANYDGLEGIDSAVPVRAGQVDIPFRLAQSDYGKRGKYWDSVEIKKQARDNIRYVRELIGENRRD